jgi:hypothetical protein
MKERHIGTFTTARFYAKAHHGYEMKAVLNIKLTSIA